MYERPTPSLKTLVDRRKPNHSLEAPFYLSPEVFAADMELIFRRHWIYVGVEPQVAEPGDCFVYTFGNDSIVIARHDDGTIRAFHNVCRHRGARLVADDVTSVGNIVCPYHQWTYGLDGSLLFADNMGPDFDHKCHGLKTVHLRNLEGMLFICLADEPPADFDVMAETIGPYIAPHQIANTKIAHQADLMEYGNWKLSLENNRECYHCAANHPELTIPLFAYSYGFLADPNNPSQVEQEKQYNDLVDTLTAKWEAMGLPAKEVERLDDLVTGFRAQRMPLDGAGESQTLDTKVASKKLLGDFKDAKLGGLSFWTQPNGWNHFMSDCVISFVVLPVDAEHTLVRTTWLVHKDAVEGVDYDLENLTTVWNATNQQDADLVALGGKGIKAAAYQPGPYSADSEYLVEKFVKWYIDRLKEQLAA